MKEFWRAVMEGDHIEDWEVSMRGEGWSRVTPQHLPNIYKNPDLYGFRYNPETKIVDLTNLHPSIPVRVWDDYVGGDSAILYPKMKSSVYYDEIADYGYVSLNTGVWVANTEGVNPWPDVCVIDFILRDGSHRIGLSSEYWRWDHTVSPRDIMASRFIRLKDDYKYC